MNELLAWAQANWASLTALQSTTHFVSWPCTFPNFVFLGFPWDAQILEPHLQRFWLSISEVECTYVDDTLGDARAGGYGTPEMYCL